MFATKSQLIKKTGKHGIGRFDFLQQLIKEYKVTKSRDAKEQVLANLANFAYDPVNYDYLWRLKVLDVFFEALEDTNNKILSFALSGICNICLEPKSREYILRNNGVKIISSFLSRNEESIILSALSILIFLETPNSKQEIIAPDNVKRILELSHSTNNRIKNLADVFLKDLCQLEINKKNIADTNIKKKKTNNSQNLTDIKTSEKSVDKDKSTTHTANLSVPTS